MCISVISETILDMPAQPAHSTHHILRGYINMYITTKKHIRSFRDLIKLSSLCFWPIYSIIYCANVVVVAAVEGFNSEVYMLVGWCTTCERTKNMRL